MPVDMTPDCISQSWFRFLHTLGNPAQLCRPGIISHTQKFLQYALASDSVVDPCQHPCLSALPVIFLKAIRGIAGQVDAFLGKFFCPHPFLLSLQRTDLFGQTLSLMSGFGQIFICCGHNEC